MDRRSFALGIIGVVSPAFTGCLSSIPLTGRETRETNRAYDINDGIELHARNQDGPVTVQTFDGDQIKVELTTSGPTAESLEAVSVVDDRTDDVLSIEIDRGRTAEGVNASLTIQVPNTVNIGSVQTTNASVVVDVPQIRGNATIKTVNGGIEAALAPDLNAEVIASTSNGSIESEGLDFEPVDRSETELTGSLGDGANTLSFQTSNASIDIQALST